MTTLDFQGYANERSETNGPFSGLLSAFAMVKRRYAKRKLLMRLSHLEEHLLTDIGIEPSDVRDALNGDGARLWARLYGQP